MSNIEQLKEQITKIIKENEIIDLAYSHFDKESVDRGVVELTDDIITIINTLL